MCRYVEWPCSLTGLHPANAPADKQIFVNVSGKFLHDVPGNASAVWGNRSSPFVRCRVDGFYFSVGAWLSSSVVQCTVLPLNRTLAAGIRLPVTVEVALNGQQFVQSSSRLHYHSASIAVSQLLPQSGPQDGSTVLLVTGAGLFDAASELRCSFGGYESSVAGVCIGPSHNCTAVRCVSPAMVGSSAVVSSRRGIGNPMTIQPVRLSFDGGQTFGASSSVFYSYPTPHVNRIVPAVGIFDRCAAPTPTDPERGGYAGAP